MDLYVFNLPDVRVVLQAHQSVLGVVEDALLDAQLCPWGSTNGGLSGRPILHRETGANVTDRDSLDVSWKVTQLYNIISIYNNSCNTATHAARNL